MPRKLTFKVFRNGELLRKKTFQQPAVNIGTGASAHLKLEDEEASPLHAQVAVEPSGKIVVSDLESEKGVQLNGTKVDMAGAESGDRLSIGTTEIVIEDATEDEVPEPVSKAVFTRLPRSPAGDAPGAIPGMMEGTLHEDGFTQHEPEEPMPQELIEEPSGQKEKAGEESAKEKSEEKE
jgi:pSer/pThr/pTyr-binding forkhead associated (FHA) protein